MIIVMMIIIIFIFVTAVIIRPISIGNSNNTTL